MNWQLIEMVALALLAFGLIAFTSSQVGDVKASAKAVAEEASAKAERATAKRWARKYRNLEVLRDLQVVLGRFTVTVFGSSQKGGVFTNPTPGSDVDLMVEVDEETFVTWAAQVYGGHAVGSYDDLVVYNYDSWGPEPMVRVRGREFAVAPYHSVRPTRIARREAAEEVLGVNLDIRDVEVDIFLFPDTFVRGEISIPAWDGNGGESRSFRNEVLAGVELAGLEPAGK